MGMAAQKKKRVDDDEYIVQGMVDENAAEWRENAAEWREFSLVFLLTLSSIRRVIISEATVDTTDCHLNHLQ